MRQGTSTPGRWQTPASPTHRQPHRHPAPPRSALPPVAGMGPWVMGWGLHHPPPPKCLHLVSRSCFARAGETPSPLPETPLPEMPRGPRSALALALGKPPAMSQNLFTIKIWKMMGVVPSSGAGGVGSMVLGRYDPPRISSMRMLQFLVPSTSSHQHLPHVLRSTLACP